MYRIEALKRVYGNLHASAMIDADKLHSTFKNVSDGSDSALYDLLVQLATFYQLGVQEGKRAQRSRHKGD